MIYSCYNATLLDIVLLLHREHSRDEELRIQHHSRPSYSSQSYDEDEPFYSPRQHQVNINTTQPQLKTTSTSNTTSYTTSSTAIKKSAARHRRPIPARRHSLVNSEAITNQSLVDEPYSTEMKKAQSLEFLDVNDNEENFSKSEKKATRRPNSQQIRTALINGQNILRVSAIEPVDNKESSYLVETFGTKQQSLWRPVPPPRQAETTPMASQKCTIQAARLSITTYHESLAIRLTLFIIRWLLG